MIDAKPCFMQMINSVSRELEARVELLNGSTILNTFTYDGALQNFSIERIGNESNFFGFGICKKLTLKLRDKERAINITKGQKLDIAMGVGSDYLYPFPVFIVEEISRDENTNALTITAYDVIYQANNYKVSDMELPQSYTILGFATAASSLLGIPIKLDGLTSEEFNVEYSNGANFDGTESVREALDDVAEATGTIYFINNNWELVFKTLDISGNPVLAIDKSKYFTLTAKTKNTLTGITSATELGDNVTIGTSNDAHQYLRDNAFLENRDDISTLIENIFSKVNGLSMYQFDLKYRGNFLLECGDKISITTKDDEIINCYVLNDTITYNGGLIGTMKWSYNQAQGETASNPHNIGDAIKQTYARVDKQQKQITLLVSEQEKNKTDIAQLKLDKNSINASVSTIVNTQADLSGTIVDIQNSLSEQNESNAKQFDTLTEKVEATMTSDEIQLVISDELAKGTDKVTTSTGFTFNDEGLTISKSDSEMSTNIDEDGMSIFKGSQEVLTANNTGVDAQNLHATTYLIIGTNSRFEDYGSDRTGCFWIGS